MARILPRLVLLALVVFLGCGSPSQPVQVPPPAPSAPEPKVEAMRAPDELIPAVKPPRPPDAQAQPPDPGRINDKDLGQLVLDLGAGVKLELVLIPAGKFMMGRPKTEKDPLAVRHANDTQHEVTITKHFYMGKYEVTQEQYEAVMGNNPSSFKGRKNPVENVSWDDAQEFCKKLRAKTGKTIQLPTEAQWEYACRAGTAPRFSFGDDDAELHKYGNYCDKSCTLQMYGKDKEHDDGYDKTAPVGTYKPNAFGLFDMHGNVQEWCQDWYGDYQQGAAVDPQGAPDGNRRVLRGGSWLGDPLPCRSAFRDCTYPAGFDIDIGFRVVDVPPEAQAQSAQEAPAPPVPVPAVNVDIETGYTTFNGIPIYGTPGSYYYYLSSGKRVAWTLPLDAMQRRAAERAKEELQKERKKQAAANDDWEEMTGWERECDLKERILRGQIMRGETTREKSEAFDNMIRRRQRDAEKALGR